MPLSQGETSMFASLVNFVVSQSSGEATVYGYEYNPNWHQLYYEGHTFATSMGGEIKSSVVASIGRTSQYKYPEGHKKAGKIVPAVLVNAQVPVKEYWSPCESNNPVRYAENVSWMIKRAVSELADPSRITPMPGRFPNPFMQDSLRTCFKAVNAETGMLG